MEHSLFKQKRGVKVSMEHQQISLFDVMGIPDEVIDAETQPPDIKDFILTARLLERQIPLAWAISGGDPGLREYLRSLLHDVYLTIAEHVYGQQHLR